MLWPHLLLKENMRSRRRKISSSPKRWEPYLAASAAGTLMALSPQGFVNADLTWVDVDSFLMDSSQGDGYFTFFGPYSLGGPGASFVMAQAFGENSAGRGVMAIYGEGNIAFQGFTFFGSSYASNIAYGASIGPAQSFDLVAGNYRITMASGPAGRFRDAGLGFVGFTFDLGGGAQYGFIEVVMDGSPGNTGTLVGYGYGDVGETVFAGQRPSVVPEPNSLGVLALGACGVAAWRRKRRAKSVGQ